MKSALAALRRKLERVHARDPEPISTGVPSLDRLLPSGGLRRGSLVEFLTVGASGAGPLAIAIAHAACHDGKALVVVDRQQCFYPPAAAAWGINLAQTLIVRPASAAEELWAMDQALRCPGVGAVWLSFATLDGRDFRRLQLAAEEGGTVGLLFRPARLRGQPTWSDVQWLVQPVPSQRAWRLQVEHVRCRRGTAGQVVQLELDERSGTWQEVSDHAAHHVHPLAELADSAATRRPSRA